MQSLTPDAAVLLFTLGLALIAFELNRPGSILPGAFGLLLALLAVAEMLHLHPCPAAAAFVALAAIVLLVQLRLPLPLWCAVLATIAMIAALLRLLPAQPGPALHAATAIFSGAVFGTGTTLLTRIARSARRNKGLD